MVCLLFIGDISPVTDSSDEHKFWSEVCSKSITDNVLSLGNGAKFVDRENSMAKLDKIYIRQSYIEIIDLIINQKDCANAVVTGTPGTGKTTLRNYFVHKLIGNLRVKGGKLCIIMDKSPGDFHQVHMFEASCETDIDDSFTWTARTALKGTAMQYIIKNKFPHDCTVWILLDVSNGDSTSRVQVNKGRTVMFTSPNEKAYKEFIKQDCLMYYLPLWSKGEATAARSTTAVTKTIFEERWKMFPGIARVLFASGEEFQLYKKRVSDAVNTLDAQVNFNQLGSSDSTDSIVHLLFYLDVVDGEKPNSFGKASLIIGSNYIKTLVLERLSVQVHNDLNKVMNDMRSCTVNSLKGMVLEPLALKLLGSSQWNFAVTQLGTQSGGCQLEKILFFEIARVVNCSNDTNFLQMMTEERGNTDNVMLIPHDGFPVVDAVAIMGSGEKRHYLLLQVTVAMLHAVDGKEAVKMLKKLISNAGGIERCALVYVLPNNHYFSSFKKQTLPDDCNELRQYKMSLGKCKRTNDDDPKNKKQRV